jgi:hypothetical protein
MLALILVTLGVQLVYVVNSFMCKFHPQYCFLV